MTVYSIYEHGTTELLAEITAHSAREALGIYSVREGFSTYDEPETRDMVYEIPGHYGALGAAYLNTALLAYPAGDANHDPDPFAGYSDNVAAGLPPDGDVGEQLENLVPVQVIAEAALQAAFGKIAELLAAEGYPVTGDFGPGEVAEMDRTFQGYVRSMALNNPALCAVIEGTEDRA